MILYTKGITHYLKHYYARKKKNEELYRLPPHKAENVICYGAGSIAEKALTLMKRNHMNVLCICDSDSNKWGKCINNIPIIPPKKLIQYDTKIIIITSDSFCIIYDYLRKILHERFTEYNILVAPFLWLMLVNVEYNSNLLKSSYDFILEHESLISSLYNMDDPTTVNICNYIIETRKSTNFIFEKYEKIRSFYGISGYFVNGELSQYNELTIIDLGAYTGDSLSDFFIHYPTQIKKYYAIEPEENNYKTLCKLVQEYSQTYRCDIIPLKKALGSSNEIVYMGNNDVKFGICDKIQDISVLTPITLERLDDLTFDIMGQLVIKMDVEGLEQSIINGGKELIANFKPILAICVYHRISDIVEIPILIRSILPDYKFVLRYGVHTTLLGFPVSKHS